MVVWISNYNMKILSRKILIFITYFIDLMANNVYYIIGTYLIQDGKSPMPVNKETNNSVIEIFSGDVIKFGQGMAFIFHIHNIIFGKKKPKDH